MLLKHLETWNSYARTVRNEMKLLIVDDGSPEPAGNLVAGFATDDGLGFDLSLYRIQKDIPWNRGEARNLGTKMTTTPWVLHTDIDHLLPPGEAEALVAKVSALPISGWYRFRRYRVGAADETRKKDKLPPEAKFGEIKPHIDSYLCTPKAYWKAGGYNLAFSGCLGGGSPFLAEMERANGEPPILDAALHVYTRDKCEDASDFSLSRDTSEYKRRRARLEREGKIKGDPATAIVSPWVKVL